MSITFERQADGTYIQVDDPPKRADMVVVVRCRDCKHATPDTSGRSYYEGMLWCSELGGDDSMPVEHDGFCAWGCRK